METKKFNGSYFLKQIIFVYLCVLCASVVKGFIHTPRTQLTQLFFLIISQINTGAPINEVMIPTGISAGEITVLAMVSETNRNIAPRITEQGIAYL